MEQQDCDFSPMKLQVKENLRQIVQKMNQSIQSMDNEDYCLLGTFEQIKERFAWVESQAASFYLMCYLSPYTDKFIDLSVTVKNLSERRQGALIVIQREDSLANLLTPGTPIGAALTSPLLESIFFTGSPLHDGAVLIQSNQIVSAANVLPLSNARIGEKKLGTRHRAAIGLTERSDALVLVVSEETGKASFALNGRLYPIHSVE
ncbi:sporulation-specific diadenylate cyclase CdaS [Effusibacillus dendaii]|uniref:Diadenylate cyclase n=1 Tax=Effusibacillus dendaii TaxID=2743772 RepID=A0A7I8DHC2_9BACL|nr:sporulation-specific diadenylate cyclase CdaS [Effusibacillus dendaii]BCJ88306.1 hypothetical protein skT53_32910 [Effusibacillus dendaii]